MTQTQGFYTPEYRKMFENFTPLFLRDADLEIDPILGDFRTGDTQDQDIDFILLAKKGQFYQEPLLGYDVNRLLNSRIDLIIEKGKLLQELNKDGFKRITDLLIGNSSDPDFVEQIRQQDRGRLPENSTILNFNARR